MLNETHKNDFETITEDLHKIREQIAKVEKKIRARGTREIQAPKFWVGDETDTDVLKEAVFRALKHQPLTLRELTTVTGARMNRISGVIIKLQREGIKVLNEGNQYRAIWRIR